MTKVLLTTIFRPFSKPGKFNREEDEKFLDYFSNRLTRESGPYVLHDNHPTVAPHMIAANIDADVTVLETPTLDEYKAELSKGYDVVGISFLVLHFPKMVHMVALARHLAPKAKVVLGGFGTALYGLDRLDVDGVCQGEGVRYMRDFLGQERDAPIVHPILTFDIRLRLGVQFPELPKTRFGVIVNGFGCPHACEFCSTSAYFGKRHLPFVTSGPALYETMARYDRERNIRDFIIYEEDFYLYKKYIEQYMRRFHEQPAPYSFGCYATIFALSKYDVEDLVKTGLSHVWIGVESADSPFKKSSGRPIEAIFDDLQKYGVTTTGSIIAGLDHHKRDNLDIEFDHLASLYPSTVQISNLIAGPGTPLRTRLEKEGRLLDKDLVESHLYSDTIFHPEFGRGELRQLIYQGYEHIYQKIGPSLYRMLATWFRGFDTMDGSPDAMLQMRADILKPRIKALALLFIDTAKFLPNDRIRAEVGELLDRLVDRLGPWSAKELFFARQVRTVFDKEEERLERDGAHVYEPATRVTRYRNRNDRMRPTTQTTDVLKDHDLETADALH